MHKSHINISQLFICFNQRPSKDPDRVHCEPTSLVFSECHGAVDTLGVQPYLPACLVSPSACQRGGEPCTGAAWLVRVHASSQQEELVAPVARVPSLVPCLESEGSLQALPVAEAEQLLWKRQPTGLQSDSSSGPRQLWYVGPQWNPTWGGKNKHTRCSVQSTVLICWNALE